MSHLCGRVLNGEASVFLCRTEGLPDLPVLLPEMTNGDQVCHPHDDGHVRLDQELSEGDSYAS
jgi:hypothetical protein